MNQKLFLAIATAAGIVAGAGSAVAAPLPNGTILKITPGNVSAVNNPDPTVAPTIPCTTGSCFGMFARTLPSGVSLYAWTDIVPGTDLGFILGKAQTSGGQELAPSALNSATGQLTAAWNFGAAYGTFFTAPDSSSTLFDDTSCTGAGCIGKTELKVFNVAWNGVTIPVGSAVGCNQALLPACTADHVAGIFVSEWTIDPVEGGAWSLTYSQVISTVFPNFPFKTILRGTVSLGNVAPVVAITPANLIGVYGTATPFAVTVTDPDGAAPICRVGTAPANGTVVLNDCTGGTYAANRGFIGTDSFTVIANDTKADSAPATVPVAVLVGDSDGRCTDQYPVSQQTITGKRGNLSVTVSGHIISMGAKGKAIKICPSTKLDYTATTNTPGANVTCKVRHSRNTGTGTIKVNDELQCKDKPVGNDKVEIKVKSGERR